MYPTAAPQQRTTFDALVRAACPGHRRAVATRPRPGTVFAGTYEIIEPLGHGGMAEIYRAFDRRLGREVALKTPRRDRLEPATLAALFEREVRATARLCHPNIVALHHVGEHAGAPFAILELLHGETLAARLARRGALSMRATCDVVLAVLAALDHAHARGVVHRDLTPNNVFLTSDDRVKLLDFGVSVDRTVQVTPATRGGGTPGYMPPEHDSAPGPRSDLWATAVLFLECVTGALPPSEAPWRAIPSAAPPRLRAVLTAALAADPRHRPRNAAQMRRELLACLPQAKARARRRAVALASVLAMVVLATIASGVVAPRLRHAPTSAQLERQNAPAAPAISANQ